MTRKLSIFELEKLIEARLNMAKEEIMRGNFRNARILLAEAITFGKERMVDLLGEEKAKKIWMGEAKMAWLEGEDGISYGIMSTHEQNI